MREEEIAPMVGTSKSLGSSEILVAVCAAQLLDQGDDEV